MDLFEKCSNFTRADEVKAAVQTMQKDEFPPDLKIVMTGDLSKNARHSFDELVNTIVIGLSLIILYIR